MRPMNQTNLDRCIKSCQCIWLLARINHKPVKERKIAILTQSQHLTEAIEAPFLLMIVVMNYLHVKIFCVAKKTFCCVNLHVIYRSNKDESFIIAAARVLSNSSQKHRINLTFLNVNLIVRYRPVGEPKHLSKCIQNIASCYAILYAHFSAHQRSFASLMNL